MNSAQTLAAGIQEGLRLQQSGRIREALAIFQSLSVRFPQSEVCWNNLGQIAYANNFLALAREALSRCVSINAKNARAWCRLGDCLRDDGLYEHAFEPYKQAIRLDPNIAAAHAGIGKAYLAVSDYDKSVKHHRIARSLAKSRLEKGLSGFECVFVRSVCVCHAYDRSDQAVDVGAASSYDEIGLRCGD